MHASAEHGQEHGQEGGQEGFLFATKIPYKRSKNIQKISKDAFRHL